MAAKGELVPGDVTDHLRAVRRTDLPPRVEELAAGYERHLGDRNRFLWKWIHSLFPTFTLSSVANDRAEHVRTQKAVLTMYVTILDDLLEKHGDDRTFEEACRLWNDRLDADPARAAVDGDTFAFIERVWRTFEEGVRDAPRYDEFANVFEYDCQQIINAIRYSALLNEDAWIANLTGATRYGSHNMVMFPYADIDLMYSPTFDLGDFGAVRDLLWDLQELARIGNWLTTWRREVTEGDHTAGVVVAALQDEVVTPEELRSNDPEAIIETITDHGIEERFRRRWRTHYRSVRQRDTTAETVDLDRLVAGMETVFEYHLASEGLK
jgi:hypothetical protein